MNIAALIITADPALADGLLRLAAAADAPAEVAHGADEARAAWSWPALVLVGADLAREVAAAGLPRRGGVVLVATAATPEAFRQAVEISAQDVAVLPDHEQWLTDAFAAATEPEGARGTTICVVGSRGGAGASVLAAALGLAAAGTGLDTLLVDADPLGGGVDLMLGLEEVEGARWHDLADRRGRLSTATLREALPRRGGLSVLSWRRGEPVPVPREAAHSLLDAATRGFELVIVDIPRYLDEAARTALRAAAVTFLLVPAEVRATVAAHGLASALSRDTADLRLIVQGPAPGGLTAATVASTLGLPVTGAFERDRRLPAAIDGGGLLHATRRGQLAELCHQVLTDLALHPHEHRAAA